MTENEITEVILKCAFKVHTTLGPGLLESAYKICLAYEIRRQGLLVDVEKPMPLTYEEIQMDVGYRLDLMVENKIVVEVKTVDEFTPIFISQTLTYLKLSGCKVGLLLNFRVTSLKNGIKRVML